MLTLHSPDIQETNLHRGLSKTISPSAQARKELLQLLHEGKIKPHMGRDRSLGPIEHNGQKLFVKKAVKSRKKKQSHTADLHLRPDLLIKYRKLVFNKMRQIQHSRAESGESNFYSIKGPDIYAVDKQFLVTEHLKGTDYMKYMRMPLWLLHLIKLDANELRHCIQTYRHIKTGHFLDDKEKARKELRYDTLFSWRVERKTEGEILTFIVDSEDPRLRTEGHRIKINTSTKDWKIHSIGKRRENLLAGRNQCKEDFQTAYELLKRELNGDKKTGIDGIHIVDEEGKTYGVKDDLYHGVEANIVFSKWINDKPEFILMDELWIKDLSHPEPR